MKKLVLTSFFGILPLQAFCYGYVPTIIHTPELGGYNWALSPPRNTTIQNPDGTCTYIRTFPGSNHGVIQYSNGQSAYFFNN